MMKRELMDWLAGLNDPGLLSTLYNLKKSETSSDWYDQLGPEQRASIERGLEDSKADRVVGSEEVWKKYGRSKSR